MTGRPEPSPKERQNAYLMLSVAALFLASNHVIGRAVHETVPALGLSFWRWLIAGLCLLPIVIPARAAITRVFRQQWKEFFLLGALVVGATAAILVALKYTTATNVALINATQPTLTVLLSWLFYGVKLTRRQVVGILVSFLGVVVMISQGKLALLASLDVNTGDLIALVSMLGFSGYAVRYVRTPHGLPTTHALFLIIVCGCLLLLPFYLGETVLIKPVPVSAESIGAILATAFLVSLGAMIFWNRGNALVGANRASIFINLIPVFAAIMAFGLLGEQFRLYHLAGLALIFSGVWLVVGRR